MKKFVWVLVGVMMIFSMVFLFTGCEQLKENLQQDAELASKALSQSGYNWNQLKTITPVLGGDISGSNYSSDIDTSGIGYIQGLQFNNEPVIVYNDNGDKVTVTLTGTVNFGFDVSQTLDLKIVAYSTGINVKVGDDDMGSVPVDIIASFTQSGTGYSVSNEGTVGNYSIDTNMTITVPVPLS